MKNEQVKRMAARRLACALLAASAAAVASAAVHVPKDYPGVRVEKDHRYGPRRGLPTEGFAYAAPVTRTNEWGYAGNGHATGQDYDLYYPAERRGALPVLVYIHGGAWCWPYDKTDHEEFFELIANDGWAVFAPDYILQTDLFNRPGDPVRKEATIGGQLRDIDLFMGEVERVARARGFDLSRLVIAGESAGGHLCSLYAYDAVTPSRLGLALRHPLKIGLVFNLVGAVDFTDPNWEATMTPALGNSSERYRGFMSAMFGCRCDADSARRFSPVPLIAPGVPEHLLSYSCRAGKSDDGCIPVSNYDRLTNALARCRVPYSGRLFAGTSHCETMQPPAKEARAWYLAELRRFREGRAPAGER